LASTTKEVLQMRTRIVASLLVFAVLVLSLWSLSGGISSYKSSSSQRSPDSVTVATGDSVGVGMLLRMTAGVVHPGSDAASSVFFGKAMEYASASGETILVRLKPQVLKVEYSSAAAGTFSVLTNPGLVTPGVHVYLAGDRSCNIADSVSNNVYLGTVTALADSDSVWVLTAPVGLSAP
jgi:hypothetical protein